jgi:hypothetical protein
MGLEKRFTLVIQIVLFVPNSNLILYRGIQIVCLYQEFKLFVCTGNTSWYGLTSTNRAGLRLGQENGLGPRTRTNLGGLKRKRPDFKFGREHREYHMNTIRTPYEHHINTIRTPYEHHTNTILTSYEHHTNTIRTPYEHHTNTIRTPYEHHMNTIGNSCV